MQATLQGFNVVASDVEAGASVCTHQNAHVFISTAFPTLNSHKFALGSFALFFAMLTGDLGNGMHDMSSQ